MSRLKKYNCRQFVLTVLLFLMVFALSACNGGRNPETFDDITEFRATDCEAMLVGMFDISSFEEDVFLHSRGIKTYIARETKLDDADSVAAFLKALGSKKSGNPKHLFIGLDPVVLSSDSGYRDKLDDAFKKLKDVDIDILYPVYLSDYYKDADLDKMKESYASVTGYLLSKEKVHVYFAGSEIWLMGNPDWYVEGTDNVLNSSLANCIVKSCFCDGLYAITEPDGINRLFEDIKTNRERISAYQSGRKDHSSENIIFLGDSIFGNYTGPDSIPAVVQTLTSADCANCGIGGSTLVSDSAKRSCKEILSVIRGESRLEDTALNEYMKDDNRESFSKGSVYLKDKNRSLTLFLEFGINDYFRGIPTADFRKELEEEIKEIQRLRDDARIILVVPGYIQIPELDDGESPFSETGGKMEDYRECIRSVGRQFHLEIFDLTESTTITAENAGEYLEEDGLHYGISGRFVTGLEMAEYLNQ